MFMLHWLSEEALRKVPGMPDEMARFAERSKVWNDYHAELARRKKLPAEEAKALGATADAAVADGKASVPPPRPQVSQC